MKRTMCMVLSALMMQAAIPPQAVSAANANFVPTFTAVVNVTDYETGETVPGANVRFVEYDADAPLSPLPERKPQANLVRVIAEWNTSDANPYTTPEIASEKGHFYAVEMEKTPEGYCFWGEDHFTWGLHFSDDYAMNGTFNYDIQLLHQEPLPNLEFPIDLDREMHFNVVDEYTGEQVTGLDLSLALLAEAPHDPSYSSWDDWYCTEVLDRWNSSDDPGHIYTMPLHFDAIDDPVFYGVKIENLPDGYCLRTERANSDGYTAFSYDGAYYRQDIYHNRDKQPVENTVYIYPVEHPPIYTTDTDFHAETFFVVVGTFGFQEKHTKLRYMYPKADGSYTADAVVLMDTEAEYNYGDILVYDGEPVMTKVMAAPNDPAASRVYYYTLEDESKLCKAGTCAELLEQKDLTVRTVIYDGFAHWSVRAVDAADKEYYYGFSAYGTESKINMHTDAAPGDTFTFAMYADYIVLPLAKYDSHKGQFGDLDGDNSVSLCDVLDALELYSNSVQLGTVELSETQLAAANVNGDNVFDLNDVICILQYYNYNEVLGIPATWADIAGNKL